MDFRTRFPLRLWRPGVDEEVDAEFEFHLSMRVRELMDGGLPEAQARQAALDKFGDYPRARRECRAIGHRREKKMRVVQYLSELRQDAAFAARQMLRAPAFTIVAVATLALGIGATTAIFSAIQAVVLRPLPVPEPDRLMTIYETWRDTESNVSASVFLDVASGQTAFAATAAVQDASFTLAREEGAERILGARVSGGFFDVFRVPAALGRVFGAPEDAPGHDRVVVLSHRLWTRQFGADPGIIGREITLNMRPCTVLGVMPASFDFRQGGEELWVPIALTPEVVARRDEHSLALYGRLRPDVSMPQATQQLEAVVERRAAVYPTDSAGRSLRIVPLMEQFVGEYRDWLFVLLGAVAFVLLIACGNVSNLLLARGASRARELAVRSALGAGQGRLVRQLFTESLVLGLTAAAAGVALARWFLGLLIAFGPRGVPRLDQAHIDGAALAFAVALAIVSSVVFGLVPAWRASRADVNATLKEAGRGAGSRGARDIVRSTLIAAEVALALVLLVGAGLLIRSAIEMQHVAPGFEPAGVFSARFVAPAAKYPSPASLLRLTAEIEEAVARIPGVHSAAVASNVPGVRTFSNGLLPEGMALDLANVTQSDGVFVSPAFFRTLGMRIVQGRPFAATDRADSPLVVILNETAARLMWRGQDPIGKRLTSASPKGPSTVIGIVADVHNAGASAPVAPAFYVPFAQAEEIGWGWVRSSLYIVAKTATDPATLAPSVRGVISTIDPVVPLFDMRTMEARMDATIEAARFNTILLTVLGVVGLFLAAVGIYGVVAYFATQRTSEIGIRLALGATRHDVVRLVVRQAALPVFAGVIVGGLGAGVAAQAIATQLVNVPPTDPLTFAVVAAGLVAVALAAALIPARRAASLDPAKALTSSQ